MASFTLRFGPLYFFAALCLVPISAFAVTPSTLDQYDFLPFSDGSGYYKVFSSSNLPASSTFDPGSSFAEGSSGGVIQTLSPQPLTIDGVSGEVVTDLSRSLTVGDLLDSLGKLVSVDNPVGLTILAASSLAPLLLDAYDSANPSSSSSSVPQSGTSFACGSSDYMIVNDTPSSDSCYSPSGPYTDGESGVSNTYPCGGTLFPDGSGPDASECPGGSLSGTYIPSSSPPSNLAKYVFDNWDSLEPDLSTALQNNPSDSPLLADQLADNDVPLSDPTPYVYNPTSNTLNSPSSTDTSTDPSTGDVTKTVSTPSYKVTPSTGKGLQVIKNITNVTSSCTSSGSCTVTNTSTSSSSESPKLGTFIPPVASAVSAPVVSSSSVSLSLPAPSVTPGVCPPPLTFSVLSQTYTIPLTPLCSLASDAQPFVESLGGVGAAIVILK